MTSYAVYLEIIMTLQLITKGSEKGIGNLTLFGRRLGFSEDKVMAQSVNFLGGGHLKNVGVNYANI